MRVSEENKRLESGIYQVQLILTDGKIDDMEATIDLLYKCAYLPMSIIIVGIGSADFTKMKILDGDEGLYTSQGKKCPRDIVQFVEFNRFKNMGQLLSKEVLHEVPTQFLGYMKLMKIIPRDPIKIDYNQL